MHDRLFRRRLGDDDEYRENNELLRAEREPSCGTRTEFFHKPVRPLPRGNVVRVNDAQIERDVHQIATHQTKVRQRRVDQKSLVFNDHDVGECHETRGNVYHVSDGSVWHSFLSPSTVIFAKALIGCNEYKILHSDEDPETRKKNRHAVRRAS